MCGRYAIYSKKKIKDIYNVDIEPNYNVSPGSNILVLDCDFVPRKMMWKFSPIWTNKNFNIINARIETLHVKNSFKNTLRCIFVTDGYYEWKEDINYKKPFYIFKKSSFLFIAGIYNDTSGCCIVTKKSQSNIYHIHHRQPLILNEKNMRSWLDKTLDLKKDYNSELYFHQVSVNVNNPQNNQEKNIKPVY